MKNDKAVLAVEGLRNQIQLIRGMPVITDADLARAYGVTTAALNQAVKRNRARFPDEFVLAVDPKEVTNLISQIVTSSYDSKETPSQAISGHGGRRKAVYGTRAPRRRNGAVRP